MEDQVTNTELDDAVEQFRSFEITSNLEERSFEGIAVPYNSPTSIGGQFMEQFAPGSVRGLENAKIYFDHDHSMPIGKIESFQETPAGLQIRGRIAQGVQRAEEVLALMREGVLNSLSIGFNPVESSREGSVVTRKAVNVFDISVVSRPAYAGALVTDVRSEQPAVADETQIATPEEERGPDLENTELEFRAIQDEVAELRRFVEASAHTEPEAPAVEYRSAAEALKAIAKGENLEQFRAYTGGTTADAIVKNGWVGDLTRLVDEAAVLRGVFGQAVLPSEGNFIEYGVLDTNSIDVDVQAAEGDDLAFGKVSTTTQTAPVKTLGGYSTLSRQEIERASNNMLDLTLRAQAIQVGKALNTLTRTAYTDAVAAQITAGNVVNLPASFTYADLLGAITDAAIKFDAIGLGISALVVDPAMFKALASLEAADGRPVLLTTGQGVNNVGSINITGLTGSLAGSVAVVMDPALDGEIAFVNSAAITIYGSAVVRLQDENIINLSKDFSVYTYAAIATEIPGAIVPVVIA